MTSNYKEKRERVNEAIKAIGPGIVTMAASVPIYRALWGSSSSEVENGMYWLTAALAGVVTAKYTFAAGVVAGVATRAVRMAERSERYNRLPNLEQRLVRR